MACLSSWVGRKVCRQAGWGRKGSLKLAWGVALQLGIVQQLNVKGRQARGRGRMSKQWGEGEGGSWPGSCSVWQELEWGRGPVRPWGSQSGGKLMNSPASLPPSSSSLGMKPCGGEGLEPVQAQAWAGLHCLNQLCSGRPVWGPSLSGNVRCPPSPQSNPPHALPCLAWGGAGLTDKGQ